VFLGVKPFSDRLAALKQRDQTRRFGQMSLVLRPLTPLCRRVEAVSKRPDVRNNDGNPVWHALSVRFANRFVKPF